MLWSLAYSEVLTLMTFLGTVIASLIQSYGCVLIHRCVEYVFGRIPEELMNPNTGLTKYCIIYRLNELTCIVKCHTG